MKVSTRFWILAATLAVAPAAMAVPITDSYVIVGNTTAISGAGPWAFADGDQLQPLRDALTDSANFGSSGVVDEPITIEAYNGGVLDLSAADAFVAAYWQDRSTTADQIQAVTDFFLGGGDLFLFQDYYGSDAFGSSLGLSTVGNSVNPTTVTSLLETPFGAPGPVTQTGAYGYLDGSAVAALGGSSCGLDAYGRTTIACFAPGDYAPGSGSLIITGDVDFVSSPYGAAQYDPENNNGRLALNLFSFGVQRQVSAVPEPGTLALFGAGLAVMSVRRRRRSV